MGIKVKAIERNINFGKGEENWQFVMQPELYGQLALEKRNRTSCTQLRHS